MALAMNGGAAVMRGQWPQWPRVSESVLRSATEALVSGRWAVSGDWNGRQPLDRELGRRFAAYSGTNYCVPVDHGSSALVLALLSTGVKPGDEVIVPGLTWVATASAVARIGAVPVLVDIDRETLCISVEAVVRAITPRTRAVIAVHLYSAMADVERLERICAEHGIVFLEDCAQAYGAQWDGRPAGSFGRAAAFSTQQGKALTSGEGGLFVTSDDEVRDRAEMYRGDGRRYMSASPQNSRSQLVEFAEVQGWNMHLSEVQAAILLDGVAELPQLDEKRRSAAAYLDRAMEASLAEWFAPVRAHEKNAVRGYYHYALRLRLDAWGGIPVAQICEALSAELGLFSHVTYPPLSHHPLLDPRRLWGDAERWDLTRFPLPVAELAQRSTILIHHSALLADEDELDSIPEALRKLVDHQGELRAA